MFLFSLQPFTSKKICVALSGGADSVCLLHYLRTNAAQYDITLSAVTCEHGIRGESSLSDLAFTKKLCAEWGIPLHIFRENVPALANKLKIGLEEAGRRFRYESFQAVLRRNDADVIATAHHKDDLIETVLFRLIRGTSTTGLNVFPHRDGLERPLLNVTRAQIMQYVQENSLPYVTDESNFDENFTRNYLRRSVLPALEKAVNGAGEHLAEFALRAAQDDEYLQIAARDAVKAFGGEVRISVDLPMPLFTRACVYALKELGVCKDYTEANLKEICALKTLQSGRRVQLPKHMAAVREYGDIVIFRPDDILQKPFEGELPFSCGTFLMNGYSLTVTDGTGGTKNAPTLGAFATKELRVDLDAFPAGCVIRTRREGDVFTPFGGRKKTLKKYLTDKKISARRGMLLPLIADGNEIYAICGVELSDRVKITENTTREGRLSVTPIERP